MRGQVVRRAGPSFNRHPEQDEAPESILPTNSAGSGKNSAPDTARQKLKREVTNQAWL
jgi:hypothetical protein